MKKLVAMAALVAGMMVGAAANAAAVDLILTQNGEGSTSWNLTVNNDSDIGVGGLNFEIVGLNVLSVNAANPGVSPDDSAINVDAFGPGRWLRRHRRRGRRLIATAPPNTLNNLLATLSGASTGVQMIPAETNAGSDTVFTAAGPAYPGGTSAFSITVVPFTVVPPVAGARYGASARARPWRGCLRSPPNCLICALPLRP